MSKKSIKLYLHFEGYTEVEYEVEPATTGGTDDRGNVERIPESINVGAVKMNVFVNGRESEKLLDISSILSPDEIYDIADRIKTLEDIS